MIAFGGLPQGIDAISQFGVQRESGREAAEIDFDDIWFYEQDGSKQIPDIHLRWVSVAFDMEALATDPDSLEPVADPEAVLLERAEKIVQEYEPIVDVRYDRNLAEDGCFFRLREGLGKGDIKSLMGKLLKNGSVAYVHPVLRVREKTVAYFNAFQMRWKTAVTDEAKQALMEQAHVVYEHASEIYRVDVLDIPYFKALNLLTEDLRVSDVTPVLVPLEPSIRADLSVPLQGCQIGDRIPFSFRIDFTDRIRIDPSSLVNINLRPGQLQKELFDLKIDPYDYVKVASQSPFVLTGWMKIYSPGEFIIPPVEIHYECTACSGDPVRSIKTDAIPLKVASIVPSRGVEAKLAVPLDEVEPLLPVATLRRQSRKLLWQGAVCFALAAALLGWAGRRWAAMRREGLAESLERQEDMLAERLRDDLRRAPTGPHWEHARDVGLRLRDYLNAKYGLGWESTKGSGEVFFQGVRERVPDRVASRLGPLLQEIDRLIAVEAAQHPDPEQWRRDVLALVDLAQSNDV
jgi:hypothetical protein